MQHIDILEWAAREHPLRAHRRGTRFEQSVKAERRYRIRQVQTVCMAKTACAAGVLLAAGAGTRYGMPKVLAEQGEWLRSAVTALAGGGCDDIVVVLGAAIVDPPASARAVIAEDWTDGLSESLRAGLSAIDADYAVLLTVDTPDVGADVVRRVLDAARSSPSGLARARYGDRPGHPVVIARRHWLELLETLSGDEGARPFLGARSDVVAVECADLATGRDIDVR
jgi:CTP:molybdopterin cytidylyltransferase MocA